MQSPTEQAKESRAAARAMRIGGAVLGMSLVLIAVADRLQESGDLTVRLGRAMVVVFSLWLLTVFMDRSLAVWGRAMLLGLLGLLVVYAAMRPVRPPPSDAGSRSRVEP
jgi:hypothetical protein